MTNEYTKRGYRDRLDYLTWTALNYNPVPIKEVINLARGLGEDKDFSDLLTSLDKLLALARWRRDVAQEAEDKKKRRKKRRKKRNKNL